MVAINWLSEAKNPAGAYHVEVASSTEGYGNQSKEPYFMVTFTDVSGDGRVVCSDVVSFSPRAMHMSIAKLKALGFSKAVKNIEANDLLGRRCEISTKVEENPKYGTRLVVDITAEGFQSGYRAKSSNEISVDGDIPF